MHLKCFDSDKNESLSLKSLLLQEMVKNGIFMSVLGSTFICYSHSEKDVENTLVKADITLNKNMVPFDTESPFITSGIRVGTPAITTRGIKEESIPIIVDLIDEVILNFENESTIKAVKQRAHKLMQDYPIFAY